MEEKQVKNFTDAYNISNKKAMEILRVLKNLPYGYAQQIADKNGCSAQVVRNVRAGIKIDSQILSQLVDLATPYYEKKKKIFNL